MVNNPRILNTLAISGIFSLRMAPIIFIFLLAIIPVGISYQPVAKFIEFLFKSPDVIMNLFGISKQGKIFHIFSFWFLFVFWIKFFFVLNKSRLYKSSKQSDNYNYGISWAISSILLNVLAVFIYFYDLH